MRKYRIALALAAGLLVAGGGWFLSQRAESRGGRSVETKQPINTTHEKIFLAEQLKRNPTHAPILLRMAQIERSEGDLAGARQHLEAAVAADPSQVDSRLELSLVCSELGDLAAAEQQNREVLRLSPDQADALYNLGAISANRGDFAQARTFWNHAMQAGKGTDSAAKAAAGLSRLGAKQ